jgi:hypothetical protein
MISSKSLLKTLAALLICTFLFGCGGGGKSTGGGGRSTAPTADQMRRLNENKSAAEAAEDAYYQKKLERIQLEKQLENK